MTFGIGTNFGTPDAGQMPSAPGLCVVRFVVFEAGSPVEGAIVHVRLEDKNPTVSQTLLSRAEHVGYTDANGVLDVEMIQYSQFTSGGVYRIRVSDPQGRKLHDRRVIVNDIDSMFAEDLVDPNE